MRFSKKHIAFIVVPAVLLTGSYFYKEYHRKPADIEDSQPLAKLKVSAIVDQYEKDETIANQQYLGKVIQVTGPISEIINQQDTLGYVFLGESNSLHKVSCLINRPHIREIGKYIIGQQITLKGICTGFLLDVELNRCVIVGDQ